MKFLPSTESHTSALPFIWLIVLFAIGSWCEYEERIVLVTGSHSKTVQQPIAVTAKGLVLFVSQQQASLFETSTTMFQGALAVSFLGLIILVARKRA